MNIQGQRGVVRLFALSAAMGCGLAQAAIPASERAVLDAIYTQTGGPNWISSSGWEGPSGTECTWLGIVCDAGQTHVEQLILTRIDQSGAELGNNLVGTLPPLTGLTALQTVDAAVNKLSGSLPSLAGLTNLGSFNVSFNQFSGNIPPLAGLSQLRRFNVFSNQLTGSIPSLSGLSNLIIFNVAQNQLVGSIPVLTGVGNLQVFRANTNQLSGSLPQLAGLSNLQEFRVYGNQLTGTIPSLSGLTNMTYFGVGNNRMTGTLPSISGLTSLQVFNVYSNQFTGTIPSPAGLANLRTINVADNKLTGTIPAVSGLVNLVFLLFNDNLLTGNIPDLSGLTILGQLEVQNNQLTGSIPQLTGLANLETFYANNNQLTGNIPTLSGLSKLGMFGVAGNRLTGSIPPLDNLPSLGYFQVGGNGLSGNVPTAPASLLTVPFVDPNNGLKPITGLSSLCNNALTHTSDTGWDTATGSAPWYTNCTSVPATLSLSATYANVATGVDATITATVTTGVAALAMAQHANATPAATPADSGTVTVTDDQGNIVCYIAMVNNTGTCDVILATGTTNFTGAYSGTTTIAPASASFSKTNPITTQGNLNQFGWTGAWYDAQKSGQGFFFATFPSATASPGTFSASWFTFDTSAGGEETNRWYTLQGPALGTSATSTLNIYATTGGNFNAGPVINTANGQSVVGTATLNFSDCGNARLTYAFTDGSGRVGAMPLTRLDANVTCDPTNGNGNGNAPGKFLLSGAWYDPATSGQGLVFDINSVQHVTVAAWYTFAQNGQTVGGGASQRWYTVQAGSDNVGAAPIPVQIYLTTGGVFNAPPKRTPTQVGTGTLTFTSCSTLTLSYSFTAGSNSGLASTINLQRIGAAPAGCSL